MTVYIPYMTVLYMVYNPQQTCEAGAQGRYRFQYKRPAVMYRGYEVQYPYST